MFIIFYDLGLIVQMCCFACLRAKLRMFENITVPSGTLSFGRILEAREQKIVFTEFKNTKSFIHSFRFKSSWLSSSSFFFLTEQKSTKHFPQIVLPATILLGMTALVLAAVSWNKDNSSYSGWSNSLRCVTIFSKGPSPITGILSQTNDVRLRGGRVEACSFGRKIGIFGLLRVVLHGFLVVSVTKKSILQTSLTWRPSWPSRVCRRLLQSWFAIFMISRRR